MLKQIVFLSCGILFGAIVGSFATLHHTGTEPGSDAELDPPFAAPTERDIERDNIVNMNASEADVHRQSRYESIKTIEDILTLPTDFAEKEALYVIAGRADSNELQNLIHQAARISDRTDSVAALGILLLRFTELDPLSAIAIARSPALAGDRIYESSVWTAWGRLDLEGALEAAQEGSAAQKNLAARSLYSSLRGFDDDEAGLIESTLGISPSRDAQGQRLYTLAAESPAKAIEYIESLRSPNEQQERFRWLAYYLNRTERAMGVDYSSLIQSNANRRLFEQSRDSYRLQSDPEAVLQEALADNTSLEAQNKALQALQHLAQTDPHKALEYLDRIPSSQSQQNVKVVVAAAMARSDPYEALAWARDNDTTADQTLLVSVITQIAQQDPNLAITETQRISNPQMRDQVYSGIMFSVATNDPAAAAQMFAMIEDPDIRRSGVRKLANSWAQIDVDAAIAWALTLPVDDQQDVLRKIGRNLARSDVDAAIKLLPRLTSRDAGELQMQIAQTIAQQRSIGEAQTYVAQFKGTEAYGNLQVAVLSRLASSNPSLAMEMAGSVEDVAARDQFVASIVGQQAAQDLQQALQWLGSISDTGARSTAMSQIARAWYSRDAVAAAAWIDGLPVGTEKDMTIVSTISMRRESPAVVLGLIDGVVDPDMRRQATLAYVRRLARTDRAEAERVIQNIELTESERNRLRQQFNYSGTIHD